MVACLRNVSVANTATRHFSPGCMRAQLMSADYLTQVYALEVLMLLFGGARARKTPANMKLDSSLSLEWQGLLRWPTLTRSSLSTYYANVRERLNAVNKVANGGRWPKAVVSLKVHAWPFLRMSHYTVNSCWSVGDKIVRCIHWRVTSIYS